SFAATSSMSVTAKIRRPSSPGRIRMTWPRFQPRARSSSPSLSESRTPRTTSGSSCGARVAVQPTRPPPGGRPAPLPMGRWRWALVRSAVDSTTLSVVPTGVGQAHPIPTGGLRIGDARWMPDGKKILVVGRSPRDDHFGLYLLAGDDSPGVPIGKAMLREWPLRISHDGRWAAAMDEDLRTVIISLADGSIRKVPGMDAGAVMPRGWAPDGTLWISGAKFPVPLLRLDPDTGKVLETRTLRPDDPGSASLLWDVAVSPDGRHVAFSYKRWVLSLA